MESNALNERINKLPDSLKQEVADFVGYISDKYGLPDDGSVSEADKEILSELYNNRAENLKGAIAMEDIEEEYKKRYGLPG